MSDLRLPYTKEELLNLFGNIKNEEELREFIQQNSASSGGGHTEKAEVELLRMSRLPVHMTGNSKGKEVPMKIRFVSQFKTFEESSTLKWQGTSSLSYPKKNFTVKLYSKHEVGWKSKRNIA